jgi:hypothetical protein
MRIDPLRGSSVGFPRPVLCARGYPLRGQKPQVFAFSAASICTGLRLLLFFCIRRLGIWPGYSTAHPKYAGAYFHFDIAAKADSLLYPHFCSLGRFPWNSRGIDAGIYADTKILTRYRKHGSMFIEKYCSNIAEW